MHSKYGQEKVMDSDGDFSLSECHNVSSQPVFACSKVTKETLKQGSKLTIKTPERRCWRLSVVFIVNFEHISRIVLVFLLLTLNM